MTLEGLGSRHDPDPVQEAFITENAAQCGYCLNGMIMTTKALLMRNPHPTEQEALEALRYNLCRCGAHVEIIRAVMRAAGQRARGTRLMSVSGSRDDNGDRPGTLTVVRPVAAGTNHPFETFIKITADGSVTAFNGHVDLGTGIRTALGQIVAEELDVSFARVDRGTRRYLARPQSGPDDCERNHPDFGGAAAQGRRASTAIPDRARRRTARAAVSRSLRSKTGWSAGITAASATAN